ncbi:hypothetical protein KVT40_000337 [Elsinoe batatas]|uniref:Uncharacterized protein n=1 Tax=Elsinoe batatas TaxID=2601811 RepID=A0A8K0L944_9PEZI|nr:hypothetical protein KVT40_000337 [Elsinoe batatas]
MPLHPYLQLIRLDRPSGLYAFYLPHLIGLAFAGATSPVLIPPSLLLRTTLLFLPFCVLLRGSTCAWNDNVDQDFDRQVARCKNRPIARGAVTSLEGHGITVVLAGMGWGMLGLWPRECRGVMLVVYLLFMAYPFGKRFTHYPQLILGFPFAGAIVFACYTVGVDPFAEGRGGATGYLCGANVVWTMIYDTIYAHQDLEDDVKAGVKSMAVRFRGETKTLCTVLGAVQVGCSVRVGVIGGFGWAYYLIGCIGTAITLAAMVVLVDLKKPESCAWWFYTNFWLVGGTMVAGLMVEYCQQHYEELFLS